MRTRYGNGNGAIYGTAVRTRITQTVMEMDTAERKRITLETRHEGQSGPHCPV